MSIAKELKELYTRIYISVASIAVLWGSCRIAGCVATLLPDVPARSADTDPFAGWQLLAVLGTFTVSLLLLAVLSYGLYILVEKVAAAARKLCLTVFGGKPSAAVSTGKRTCCSGSECPSTKPADSAKQQEADKHDA